MNNPTRAAGTIFAAAALTLGLAPAASADHRYDDNGRGWLKVCVDGLNGREADIEVNGRTDFDDEVDGGCETYKVRRGYYVIELDAPRRCEDDRARAWVRSGGLTRVWLDADCPRWKRWHDGDDGPWDGNGWGDDD